MFTWQNKKIEEQVEALEKQAADKAAKAKSE